jgi:hypothetical protein
MLKQKLAAGVIGFDFVVIDIINPAIERTAPDHPTLAPPWRRPSGRSASHTAPDVG